MLKINLGFGSNFNSVAFHTNANFNGYEQPYPYAPIWYSAPAPTGGQPIIMRTSTIPFLAGSLRRGAF